jgi:GH24 family phage-related lysozyme (muramidase)
MYRNPQETAEAVRASQRMAGKRSKYAPGSGKQQVKKALGSLEATTKNLVRRPNAGSTSQSPLDDLNEYRIAMMENRDSMADVVKTRLSNGSDAEVPSTDYDTEDPSILSAGDPLTLLKSFEGFREKAYWDNNQWSIGFGTKASGKDAKITKAEAEAAARSSFNKARAAVLKAKEKYGYDWADHQVDALSLFTYNLGPGKLKTLTEEGTRGDEEISEMMLEYNMADGKRLPGLVKRRQAEARLFTQGYEGDDQ